MITLSAIKASELIKRLQELIETEGDLNIGYHNSEYNSFEVATHAEIETSSTKEHLYYGNDAELGIKFIGIR